MEPGCVGGARDRIFPRPAQRQVLFDERQQGQFAVHGRCVALQFRTGRVCAFVLVIRVLVDPQGHSVAEHRITNFGFHHFPFHVARLVCGRANNLGSDVPKLLPIERFGQRLLQRVSKLGP